MQTQSTATDHFQLPVAVLTEIRDAVIVTDNDDRIVYWNGPAEQLYGLRAGEVLGHLLDRCVPDLKLDPDLLLRAPSADRNLREVVLRRGDGKEVILECSASPLHDKQGLPTGTLWIQRDVSERKRLEAELRSYQALLRERSRLEVDDTLQGSGRSDVVLWAEDDDNDALLLARAWRQAQVEDELLRVKNGTEVIDYLSGVGCYADRDEYPLPRLLLLDIRMPGMTGMQVLEWLHTIPCFRDLPVVILTSSGATSDVHEAARFGVKGYLVKPVNVTEWIVKVKTVTSQCK